MKNCPACNKAVKETAIDCPFCGVIFAKWQERQAIAQTSLPPSKGKALLDAPRSRPFHSAYIYIPVLIFVGVVLYMKRGKFMKLQNTVGIASMGMLNPHDFYRFVASDEREIVQRYLKAGMSPDTMISGDPVLNAAIRRRNIGIVSDLLNAGANTNIRDAREGMPPLFEALLLNDYPETRQNIVKELLSRGADVNVIVRNKTLVQWAQEWGVGNLLMPGATATNTVTYGTVTDDYIKSLLDKLSTNDKAGGREALEELKNRGASAARALVRLLDDPGYTPYAAAALTKFDTMPSDLAPSLEAKSRDKTFGHRREAVMCWIKTAANNQIKTQVLIKALALDDPSYQIHHEVLRLLIDLGPQAKEALPTLNQLKEHQYLRFQIREAIERIEGLR